MTEQNGDGRAAADPSSSKPPAARPEAFGRGAHVAPDKDSKPTPDDDSNDSEGDESRASTEKNTDKNKGGAPGKEADKPNSEQPKKKPFWKRPVLLTAMILVPVLLIVGGLLFYLHERNYETTDDAFIDGRIVHVSPRVSGKIMQLLVTDNQWVEADTPLVEIDPADYQVKRDQARAGVEQQQAKVEQAKADVIVAQANAAQAAADVDVARANAINAQRDFQRFDNMPAAARSKQQLDAATAQQASSAATVTAMQKKAAAMVAQVDAGRTAISAAQGELASVAAMLEQADLNLRYTKVVAGHAGWVTRRTVERGNYVQIGQEILDVVPRDVWVTANYKETQLAKMKPGQAVTVSVDAYPDMSLRGHIDSVQSGTGAVFSLLPPENATGNYVKVVQRVPVKILLDGSPNDSNDRKLSPGMSVQPRVTLGN